MRINLTKSEIINSIYMQIGYSKTIAENLVEDIFEILLENLPPKITTVCLLSISFILLSK